MSSPSSWCDPSPDEPDPVPGEPGVELNGPPDPSQIRDLRPSQLSNLICSLGWRASLITGVLRDLLIQHFSDSRLLTHPIFQLAAAQGRPTTWQENEDTGILIESIHRWRGDLVGKRPAIVIKRNSYSNFRLGIGDKVRVDGRGHQVFETAWVGSSTAFCIHGSGAGVEILSEEVRGQLHQYHPIMTRYLGMLRWSVTEIGPIAEIEEAKETFVVPISVGWAFQERWILENESPKLRRFNMGTLFQF